MNGGKKIGAAWIFGLLAAFLLPLRAAAVDVPDSVRLGGIPFGIRFPAQGIVVVGFSEMGEGELNPAYAAGLRRGDVITAVDGEPVSSVEEITEQIGESRGLLEITYLRDRREKTALLCPAESMGGRRAGMLIRDTAAGIGTLTYVREDGRFGGLGHGICRADTGELIPIPHGTVSDVIITGVTKGAPGEPGELEGNFTGEAVGKILANTDCGVFGELGDIPAGIGEAFPVGSREEVHGGRATILCTLSGTKPEEYEIRITDINRKSRNNRSFSIVVTDPALIEETGGIVQGMSGSPVLQDGRLVGAVTHVLISNPREGYGIFIDNMFGAAEEGGM